jgi:hypothetical protein
MTKFFSYADYSNSKDTTNGLWMFYIKIECDADDFWNLKTRYTKDYDFLRCNITYFLGVDGKVLTRHLRQEYNCLTQYDKKKYMFSSRDSCDIACEYLNTLLVARKLRG